MIQRDGKGRKVGEGFRMGIREPLVWRQGSQASMRVARQIASLLWSHGRD